MYSNGNKNVKKKSSSSLKQVKQIAKKKYSLLEFSITYLYYIVCIVGRVNFHQFFYTHISALNNGFDRFIPNLGIFIVHINFYIFYANTSKSNAIRNILIIESYARRGPNAHKYCIIDL